MFKTDLVQFVGYSTNDGLVSEVEMEPLKIHLPVNPLITMCLSVRDIERWKITQKIINTLHVRDRRGVCAAMCFKMYPTCFKCPPLNPF